MPKPTIAQAVAIQPDAEADSSLPLPAPAPERRLYSFRALAKLPQYCGVFTEASLRWWKFDGERPGSPYAGFLSCLVRIGRRLLVDLPSFEAWLASQRQG